MAATQTKTTERAISVTNQLKYIPIVRLTGEKCSSGAPTQLPSITVPARVEGWAGFDSCTVDMARMSHTVVANVGNRANAAL